MKKPKFLLIGHDQCDWHSWSTADCTAIYNPNDIEICCCDVNIIKSIPNDLSAFDGIVISTPNYEKTDVRFVCDMLGFGLPVLVCKLRLNSSEDLNPIRKLPADTRKRLRIGEHYQYMPGAVSAYNTIHKKVLGNIEYISLNCILPLNDRPDWMNAYNHLILEDLAYHHLAVVASICGDVSGLIYASSYSPSWLTNPDRTYSAFLLNADAGWHFVYDTRWGAVTMEGNFFGELTIEGTNGQIWTNGQRAILKLRNGGMIEQETLQPRYNGWSGTVDHFGDLNMKNHSVDYPSLKIFDEFDIIIRLLYGAVKSAEQNVPVQVN